MIVRLLIGTLVGVQVMFGVAFAEQQSPARKGGETTVSKQFGGDKSSPLLLQADDLVYDNRNNRVLARGNVEIYYNEYALFADEVVYDRTGNTLTAIGNVRIKEPDGALINADRITLKDDFRDGFIRSLKAVTQDDARIAASNAYRKDGSTTVYENGVFTPYKLPADGSNTPPLWRIKATKITQDKVTQNLYYENAQFEVFGIPIAWVPYFYTPDTSVKHRSGFLTPEFKNSTQLGFVSAVPYFYSISPSADVTLTPEITTKAGYLMQAEYRQKLFDGSFKVNLSGAYNDNSEDFAKDRQFRGSAQTKGEFGLGSFWRLGWDATIESDDTFRRFYRLDSIYATERVSQVYLTGQGERNYFNMAFYRFGNLTGEVYNYSTGTYERKSNATAYPVIDYNYVHNKAVFGGELSFDLNAVALNVDDPRALTNSVYRRDSNHIATEVKWRRSITDDIGQVFTPFTQARGDVYQVSKFQDRDGVNGNDDIFTRQILTAGLDYRYPFVANTGTASHVIEPVAQIITRVGSAANSKIPNEDAQSLVFDDTLLFDIDKFSGYDRIETGTRANYGAQYTMQAYNGISLRAVGGESVHIAGRNPYDLTPGTGLATDRSDYVLGGYFDFRNMFRLVSQIRLNESDFSVARQDYSIQTKLGAFQGAVSYVAVNPQPNQGFFERRQEVAGFAAYKWADQWTLFGDVRYNVEDGRLVRDAVGVQYSDEGLTVSVTYAQTFVTYQDIKPDTTFTVRVGLKYLGQQMISDSIGDLSPEAAVFK